MCTTPMQKAVPFADNTTVKPPALLKQVQFVCDQSRGRAASRLAPCGCNRIGTGMFSFAFRGTPFLPAPFIPRHALSLQTLMPTVVGCKVRATDVNAIADVANGNMMMTIDLPFSRPVLGHKRCGVGLCLVTFVTHNLDIMVGCDITDKGVQARQDRQGFGDGYNQHT